MPPKRRRQREEKELEDESFLDEDITVDAPPSIDPYAVLSLRHSATADEIKSAYRKAALKHHPDKAPDSEKEAAHTKFQEVAFAYAILSDERRRKRYDTTGRTEESLDADDEDFNWTDFFREQYRNVVTTDAINKFSDTYKGSEEERGHVLAAYEKCRGQMGKIYAHVMLSDVLEDEERFRAIIDRAIADGEVEDFEKYSGESERSKLGRIREAKKRRDREAREAEEGESNGTANGKKDAGTGDLAAMIQQRQKGRAENFLDGLEAKYAAPKGGTKGAKRAMDEPPEEMFAKNREQGKSKRAKK
ncbi:hypothetical protein LTR37_009896 [Vermiconidia calcicola]|uniref:Uncharacterized protein n=1 Tax=Vermiconidia calcicola TaxID=1690605 RepID=A0ACC3N6G7_9PEZI|nr:hypothetical protein LTR37_009896 [Vermiconidia calcicola]